ncbi:hypothetical protein L798_06381 [Zootermopsis nevadensis]|uniref:Uncharacterized protein n=1 Tax=Zootermopsis nevadensis TaxID=136037 RepID=A0A067RJL2_ZOONE|nr:hypothetical protein L798_06381 [Zootermopsis nevadensis]
MQMMQLRKTSQQEIHRLLEELKSKQRTILQLERQVNLLTGRMQKHQEQLVECQHDPRPREVRTPVNLVIKSRNCSIQIRVERCIPIHIDLISKLFFHENVFWNVPPCTLVKTDRRFRGVHCLHQQGNERSFP